MWKSGGGFWSAWPTASGSIEPYAELIDTRSAPMRHVAIIDNSGVIVDVNQAWRDFADNNGMDDSSYGIGLNYLTLCDLAVGDEWAERAAKAIRGMLAGRIDETSFIYPCVGANKKRSFIFETHRFSPVYGVVSHTYLRQLSRLGIL